MITQLLIPQVQTFSSIPFEVSFIIFIIILSELIPAAVTRKACSFVLNTLNFPGKDSGMLLTCFEDLKRRKASKEKKEEELLNLKYNLSKFQQEKEELTAKFVIRNERKSLIKQLQCDNDLLLSKLQKHEAEYSLLQDKFSEEKKENSEKLLKYTNVVKELNLKNKIREEIDRIKNKMKFVV